MLPLAKVAKLETSKVLRILTRLPQSRYFRVNVADMHALISPGDARRYLTALTILNDKEKSNLSQVDEQSLVDEISELMNSMEGGQFQQMQPPSLTGIQEQLKLNNSEPGLPMRNFSYSMKLKLKTPVINNNSAVDVS